MIVKIEQDLVKRLNDVAKTNSVKVRIESYGGQLGGDLLDIASESAPAIWVTFGGMAKTRKIGRRKEYEASFAVIAAATAQDQAIARHGGHQGKVLGAYGLIQFVIATLDGFTTDDLSQALDAQKVSNLFNAKIESAHLSVYSTALSCRFIWQRDLDPNLALDDLEKIYHETAPAIGDGAAIETEIPQQEAS